MKKILIVAIALLGLSIVKADAQYVRVKPGFSVGITIGAPGPAPYSGAIWIGPEWRWRGSRYVEVPGYWQDQGVIMHGCLVTGGMRAEGIAGYPDIGDKIILCEN